MESRTSSGRFFDGASTSEVSVGASNPKLEMQQKMENKRLAEEANYSYKPTLYTKPRKDSDKIDDNRYDRLYSDALKRHLESKWKESVEDKDLTFKPKISTKGSNSRSSSRERGSVGESLEQRLHSFKPRPVEVESYSFKPKITQRAKSIDRSQFRGETPDRLYQNSKVIQEKLEGKRNDQAAKQREECTFTPRTNLSKSKKDVTKGQDLAERMSHFLAARNSKVEEAAKAKLELERESATFNPVINPSKRSATPTSSVFQRLANTTSDKELFRTSSSSAMDEHLTFKPTLHTKRAPSPSPRSADFKDVHDRLFREGVQRQKDLEMERKLLQEENESHMTFTPSINRRSLSARGDRDSVASTDTGPVFERLSATSNRMYMQEVLSKIKTDLELKDCTFKPKLATDKHVRENADEPIYLRLAQHGERMKAEQAKLAEERAAEEEREMTFAPKINKNSNSISKRRVSNVDIYDRLNVVKQAPPEEPLAVEPVKKVLPKEDVEKIFRRLSITNTISSDISATVRQGGEVESPTKLERKKSVVLAEKDMESLFQKLHSTSYNHGDPESMVKTKVLPTKDVEAVFAKLGKTNHEAFFDELTAPSPTRRASRLNLLLSPSTDSVQSSNVSSPRAETPKEMINRRRESFRDIPAAQLAQPVPAAAMFPPSPPPRVPSAQKLKGGGSTSAARSDEMPPRSPAAKAPSPAATPVAAVPAAASTPVVSAPPSAAKVVTPAAAPVPTKIPTPSTSSAASKVFAAPEVASPSVSAPAPASAPLVAAPAAAAPSAITSKSAKTSTSTKTTTAASSSSSSASSGAANPDFFSKLEASLTFLESQLDNKGTSTKTKKSDAGAPVSQVATH